MFMECNMLNTIFTETTKLVAKSHRILGIWPTNGNDKIDIEKNVNANIGSSMQPSTEPPNIKV